MGPSTGRSPGHVRGGGGHPRVAETSVTRVITGVVQGLKRGTRGALDAYIAAHALEVALLVYSRWRAAECCGAANSRQAEGPAFARGLAILRSDRG